MAELKYRANLDKFIDSLAPEQIIFLGSLIENSIQKNDFANLDLLATLMFERVKDQNLDMLHQQTHEKFSEIRIE
jgi:hypothetical protein